MLPAEIGVLQIEIGLDKKTGNPFFETPFKPEPSIVFFDRLPFVTVIKLSACTEMHPCPVQKGPASVPHSPQDDKASFLFQRAQTYTPRRRRRREPIKIITHVSKKRRTIFISNTPSRVMNNKGEKCLPSQRKKESINSPITSKTRCSA